MKRRTFVRTAAAGAGLALGHAFWKRAYAAPASPGPSPYGNIARKPDANGLRLPPGFSSRVIAKTGTPVGETAYVWHSAPDGGACFLLGKGSYAYVSNSEVQRNGGASMIRFDAAGNITAASRILSGTSLNCAGGATPWGTWLSCEEWHGGNVFECYLDGRPAARRKELGTFSHEAVAVHPGERTLYLTEDAPEGRFYRFRPTRYPALDSGQLEAARVDWDSDRLRGTVSWIPVDRALPASENPSTAAHTTPFDGGEGCFCSNGRVYFTTKGDDRVWAYDPANNRLEVLYAANLYPGSPLRGVDNVLVSRAGELFVAEDGDDMQICIITPARIVAPFLKVEGHPSSEITGPAFSPAGDRLYFSSQRGRDGEGLGITFEVRGPFKKS